MKLLIICLAVLASSCATLRAPTYSHLRNERVGPVTAEVWRNNKDRTCERRVYLDSMYFKTDVPCEVGK
jgi:hypothetical protein